MKLITTYFILLFACSINAQSIKLNYEPSGQIIKLYFDSLTIYTDTSSLFSYLRNNRGIQEDVFYKRMKNLVGKQFEKSNTDTANFCGRFIAFNDSINDNYEKEWYVNTTLINLVHQNKLKMIDKQGAQVSRVTTKRVGSKKKGFVVRYYMIKNTEEILFFRLIYEVLEVPRF